MEYYGSYQMAAAATSPERPSMIFLLLQWSVQTSQCNYRLVAPMCDEVARQGLETTVAAAVREISIPPPYRDRINALVYESFNDGELLAKVRDSGTGIWRSVQAGDLPDGIIEQLVVLGSSVLRPAARCYF